MSKFLETIGILVVSIIVGLFVNLYETWVIIKIGKWYNMPLSLTFLQWFGIIAILQIINIKRIDIEEVKDSKGTIAENLANQFIMATVFTIGLGTYYFYYIIIK